MWISNGRLTAAKQIEVSFSFESPGDPIYQFDNLELRIQSRRLELVPKRFEPALMDNAATVVRKILSELPHTPVTACGVNFNFECPQPSGLLLSLFNIEDNNAASDQRYQLKTTSISRRFDRDGKNLNVSLNFAANGKVGLAFNFHKEAKTATEASEFLASPIIELQQQAEEFLRNVYEADIVPKN